MLILPLTLILNLPLTLSPLVIRPLRLVQATGWAGLTLQMSAPGGSVSSSTPVVSPQLLTH